MLSSDKTTEIYYIVDEFCHEFDKVKEGSFYQRTPTKRGGIARSG